MSSTEYIVINLNDSINFIELVPAAMKTDVGGIDYTLFQEVPDADEPQTDDEVIRTLSICPKQAASAFVKATDRAPVSSSYHGNIGKLMLDQRDSVPGSLLGLESSNATKVPEENNAQNTDFIDNICLDNPLAIIEEEDNADRYSQHAPSTREFFDNEENELMLFRELQEDPKFSCLSDQSVSATFFKTADTITDVLYDDQYSLFEGNPSDTVIATQWFGKECKDYTRKPVDTKPNNTQIHSESSSDVLQKNYELLIDPSDDEDQDDRSLIKFLALDTSLLVQEGKAAVSPGKTKRLFLNSNDLCLHEKADKRKYGTFHGISTEKTYEQIESVVEKISSSDVNSRALSNLDAGSLGLLEKRSSDSKRSSNNETNALSVCKSDKVVETELSGERVRCGNDMIVSSSTDDSKSTRTKREIQNELFSNIRKQPKVLKWWNCQKIRNHSEDRNYGVKCAFNKRNLSERDYDFSSHSPRENVIRDNNNRLRNNPLYCNSSIVTAKNDSNRDRVMNRQAGHITTPYKNREKLLKEINLYSTISDSALEKFSTEKLSQDKKMECVRANLSTKLSLERLSSYKNRRHMIAVQSKNLKTSVANNSMTQECHSAPKTKNFETHKEIGVNKYVPNAVKQRSFRNPKFISHKLENTEKSFTTLKKPGLRDVAETNFKVGSSISKLKQISKMPEDVGATSKPIVQDSKTKPKLGGSLDKKFENKFDIEIVSTHSLDEFIDVTNESTVVKSEVESDDNNQGSNVDVLYFMLLKEMWDRRRLIRGQFDASKSDDLEEDEVFISLLEEFVTKKNYDKYIPQLIGIDKLLREQNTDVDINSLDNNLESQEVTCLVPTNQFKKTGDSNRNGNTSTTETCCSENKEIIEAEALLLRDEIKESAATSDLTHSPDLRQSKKVDLNSEGKSVEDKKIADESNKQKITSSAEIASTTEKYKFDKNPKYEPASKWFNRHKSVSDNLKQSNNNSPMIEGQCSSCACNFMKSKSVKHFADLVFQPFVKLDVMNMQDLASIEQRIKPPVRKCTKFIDRRKHTSRINILESKKNRWKNSPSNQRTSSKITTELKTIENRRQERLHSRRRDSSDKNIKENVISNSDCDTLGPNRLIDLNLPSKSLNQITKLPNVGRTLNKSETKVSRSVKKMTNHEQASGSDISIVRDNTKADDRDSCQSTPIKRRKVEATLQHSIDGKLEKDESISRRITRRFSTTPKNTLESNESKNQRFPEIVPIKTKRRHCSIREEPGKNRDSLRTSTRKGILKKPVRNSPSILKKDAKLSNYKNRVKRSDKKVRNGKKLSYKQDDKGDAKGTIKSVKVNGFSSEDQPWETRQQANNVNSELFKLNLMNFCTSNGYGVKFQYINERLAVLDANITNVHEAESFVKAFARFDCANYILWRDSNRARYTLHRTWLCATNGTQNPDVFYNSLSCQARIHISIKNQPSANNCNKAHVLIYMEHTHNKISKRKRKLSRKCC